MKKRTIIITVIGVAILTIIIVTACDKNKTTGPEESDLKKHPTELVGSWHSQTVCMDVIITSNSAQQVADVNSPGNGSIEITGDQQAELT